MAAFAAARHLAADSPGTTAAGLRRSVLSISGLGASNDENSRSGSPPPPSFPDGGAEAGAKRMRQDAPGEPAQGAGARPVCVKRQPDGSLLVVHTEPPPHSAAGAGAVGRTRGVAADYVLVAGPWAHSGDGPTLTFEPALPVEQQVAVDRMSPDTELPEALARPALDGRLWFAAATEASALRLAESLLAHLASRHALAPSAGDDGAGVDVREAKRTSVLTLVYARASRDGRVLLGRKKRGFGAGKLNGFGGKVEEGETPVQGAARELREESGLAVRPEALRPCGRLIYEYDSRPKLMEVHVYDVHDSWEGQPMETEEMEPVWFEEESIPLQDMWADDEYWLKQYLSGALPVPFEGRFRFKGHEGEDSNVVLEFSVGPCEQSQV